MNFFVKYSLALIAVVLIISYAYIDYNSIAGGLVGMALFLLAARSGVKLFNGEYKI